MNIKTLTNPGRVVVLALVVGCVLVLGGLVPTKTSASTTFFVNTTSDAPDTSHGDGSCKTAASQCSLRAAIEEANALAGTDTIQFSLGAGFPTIQPLTDLPAIVSNITIDGKTGGATKVQLDGSLAPGAGGLFILSNAAATVRGLVINRFDNRGICVDSTGIVTIQGNYIGTDTAGTVALGNFNGIETGSCAGGATGTVMIGGTLAGQGNVISGNDTLGISIAEGNVSVFGNYIGTQADGVSPLGNVSAGIGIGEGTSVPTVFIGRYAYGGGAENVIAFNQAGIEVGGSTTTAAIDINSIHSNEGLGIDLRGAPFVTEPIDTQDPDSGPNDLQNHPLVTKVNAAAGSVSIDGYVTGAPNTPLLVVFYDSATCDPSGFGEGQTYIGHTVTPVSPAEDGWRPFSETFTYTLPAGHVVTATAATGFDFEKTSEFSQCPNPSNDYDGDGFKDPQQHLHLGPANTNTAFDNCPQVHNTAQLNSDGNFIDNSPPLAPSQDDKTRSMSDAIGDACDIDQDNDGLYNLCENPAPHPSCTGSNSCPTASAMMTQTDADSDGDRVIDGAECVLGTDPMKALSKPTALQCATHVGVAVATDTDGDRLRDGVEFCGYGTNPTVIDSDGDASSALQGARDGCEAMSVNGDRTVNAIDQGLLAGEILRVPPPAKLANFDFNKDTAINAIDQALIASIIVPAGQCPLVP